MKISAIARVRHDDRVDDGYEYLGNGPEATGNGAGWVMSGDLYARCTGCGSLMSLDPTEHDDCVCGAMNKDPDAARFGSTLGDAAIEVWDLSQTPAYLML